MALRDGRCPNCGSLLHLDTNSETGHCLFCDAVFPTQNSFDIAANPKGVEFPNLPQPKYEGPVLTNRQAAAVNFPVNQPAVRKKQSSKSEPEPYVRKEIKIPDVRIPLKMKILIGIVIIAVAGIFAAITVPLSISRDADRNAILSALPAASPIKVDSTSEAGLRRIDNSYLLVAVGETVTKEQAVALFKAFCQKRAEIRGETAGSADQTYQGNTLRLAHAQGGYLIDSPKAAALDSGEAVKVIS